MFSKFIAVLCLPPPNRLFLNNFQIKTISVIIIDKWLRSFIHPYIYLPLQEEK